MAFCDRVNKELEGPQISVRLLAHKIQSPQEREALYALTVSDNSREVHGREAKLLKADFAEYMKIAMILHSRTVTVLMAVSLFCRF